MEVYKNDVEFYKNSDKELQNLKLKFRGMEKGTLSYVGELDGKIVYASVSESCVSSFDFSPEETVMTLVQSEYAIVKVDGELVFNNH